MENLILTTREHKVLKKFKKCAEKRFNVKIQMPNLVTSAESDVIFVSIDGEVHNRERVKKFLSEKMNMATEKVECKENIILITISDSEEESAAGLELETNSICVVDDLSHENSPNVDDEVTVVNSLEDSFCFIETPVVSKCSSKHSKDIIRDQLSCIDEQKHDLDNSVYIIESPVITDISSGLCRSITNSKNDRKGKGKRRNIKIKNKKIRSKDTLPSSQPTEEAEICEVSSTTEVVSKKVKLSGDALEKFIPLQQKKRKLHPKGTEPNLGSPESMSKEESNNDVIVIDKPSSAIRPLRPIVIDGSNVAIEHGRVSDTFSAKGIQLAVDYFLNRGHTQVTAFVPRFRRFCNRKNFPTADPEILDDLAKKQHVVFTPSRRLNGKCIASYDDRFIVQLASANGGVIVSNDNYRDLVSENDSFKEVIEKRLLMFCFVGDIFMIPSDPLGRNGPSLSKFLSFPPDG